MKKGPRELGRRLAHGERADLLRRRVLQGLGGALGGVALGCGSNGDHDAGSTTGPGGAGGQGGAGGRGGSGGRGTGGQGGAGGQGGSGGTGGQGGAPDGCVDLGGWSPSELLSKIEHVVVLCMENRSFDHYLGSLSLREHRDLDGLTGSESNPDPNGVPISSFELDDYIVADPPHDWDPAHQQWNLGQNDGFVQAFAGPNQQVVMGYHVRAQLPITYALADAFTVCDRYFASLLGPTWPNRFYLHGGTSKGVKDNTPNLSFQSIFDLLDDAGIANANYFGDIPWATGAYLKTNNLHTIDTFLSDVMSGSLPPFSLIDPTFFGSSANDDHPEHDMRLGQAFIATILGALGQSPLWNKCLFVLTYDEHGGLFDHVAPPTTIDDDPDFAQLGFRVPTIVCGPFVRKGCVDSTVLEHCSVLKTVTTRFGLTPLNQRVAQANDLSQCLNPEFFGDPQPLPTLPAVPVSLRRIRQAELRRPGASHQELWDMAERGRIPRHLDRRRDAIAIAERWLRFGADLGVVRLV